MLWLVASAHQPIWHHNPIGLALIGAAVLIGALGLALIWGDDTPRGYRTPGTGAVNPGAPLFVLAYTLAIVGCYFLVR